MVDTLKSNDYNDVVSPLRGEIYIVNFDGIGSEQKGTRPAIIIQNNVGNRYSRTVLVAPLTSKVNKHEIPTHVKLSRSNTSLIADSVALMEQVRVVDKTRLKNKVAVLDNGSMDSVDRALKISLGLA